MSVCCENMERRFVHALDRVLETRLSAVRVIEQQVVQLPPIAPNPASILRARRGRDRFFSADLFGEPGWDMLLDLHDRTGRGADVSVGSLCVAAAVPPTTALRWIAVMVDAGVLVREDDRSDHRRVLIRLAPATAESLVRYFAWLGRPA
jgi:hypothetical protein